MSARDSHEAKEHPEYAKNDPFNVANVRFNHVAGTGSLQRAADLTKPAKIELDERAQRAEVIVQIANSITRLNNGKFVVASQFEPEICYIVNPAKSECTCPDYVYRGVVCKHLLAVKEIA